MPLRSVLTTRQFVLHSPLVSGKEEPTRKQLSNTQTLLPSLLPVYIPDNQLQVSPGAHCNADGIPVLRQWTRLCPSQSLPEQHRNVCRSANSMSSTCTLELACCCPSCSAWTDWHLLSSCIAPGQQHELTAMHISHLYPSSTSDNASLVYSAARVVAQPPLGAPGIVYAAAEVAISRVSQRVSWPRCKEPAARSSLQVMHHQASSSLQDSCIRCVWEVPCCYSDNLSHEHTDVAIWAFQRTGLCSSVNLDSCPEQEVIWEVC